MVASVNDQIWFIWFARNSVVFRQESVPPENLGHMIRSYRLSLEKAKKLPFSSVPSDSLQKWKPNKKLQRTNISWVPPPANFVKINFNGSKL